MSQPVDEAYTLDVQDPNDPVWATDSDIAGMQAVGDEPLDELDTTPAIRRSDGFLEFIGETIAEVTGMPFESVDNPIPAKPFVPEAVRTRELGSDKWRGRAVMVSANNPSPIVRVSNKRRKVTLYNGGANAVYIASEPNALASQNGFLLQPLSATLLHQVTLETRDDIWGIAAVAATPVYLVEEFDMEC